MERKEASRHLAAILFTDIVGYTDMMQHDEELALETDPMFGNISELPDFREIVLKVRGEYGLD